MGACIQKCSNNYTDNKYVCCYECENLKKCIEEESICWYILDEIYDYNHRKSCINYSEDKNNDKDTTNKESKPKVIIKVRPDKNNPESSYTTTVYFNDKDNNKKELEFKYYLNVCMGVSSHDICKLLDFLGIEYFVVVYE